MDTPARSPSRSSELVAATTLCDRVIRECVAQLVLDGHPITTRREAPGGYQWTTNHAEIEAEYARLQSHGKAILARADALAKNHLEPQQDLFR